MVLFTIESGDHFQANVDSEIQPVVDPDQCDPVAETKKTKADKKVKQKKKSESDVEAAIGNPWTTGLFNCHEDRTNGDIPSSFPFFDVTSLFHLIFLRFTTQFLVQGKFPYRARNLDYTPIFW